MMELNEFINGPDCPTALMVHMGKCPEKSWEPEPVKGFNVGTTIPLTVQWPAPDNWLAHLSEQLAGILYKLGIGWRKRWGRWRLDSVETKAEIIQNNQAGLKLQITSGFLWEGVRGTFKEGE